MAGPASATSAPAYDDLERFAYARHRTASPYTVLELLAAEPGMPGQRYRAAAAAYQRWRRTGVLVEDIQPAFYRYDIHELRQGRPAVVRGVLAAVAVGDGGLLAHEAVDADRVATRLERMVAVPADLAPIYAVQASSGGSLREILDAPPQRRPLIALTDEAGADHRIWPLDEPGQIDQVRASLAATDALIADGHHRYAAAVAHRRADPERRRTLAFLVDGSTHAPQLRAIHRTVTPLRDEDLERLERAFIFHPIAITSLLRALDEAPSAETFGFIYRGTVSLLTRRGPEGGVANGRDARQTLDAAAWESAIRPLLDGVIDYRNALPTPEDPLPSAAAMFVLRPPTLQQVFDCARAGQAMPAKTTWFRPKPRAGLVMRSLDSPP